MRIRGLQEIKVCFETDEETAESLVDALFEKYGSFDYDNEGKTYTLTKVVPIIIDRFNGDDIDSPYMEVDTECDIRDVENFIRRWDEEMRLNFLSVKEEIGEEE